MAKIKSSQFPSMYPFANAQGRVNNSCLKYRNANGEIKNGKPRHKSDSCIEWKSPKNHKPSGRY